MQQLHAAITARSMILGPGRPQLAHLGQTAAAVHQIIRQTALLAEGISVKVKALDAEQSKVKLAIHQVDDAQQLKVSSMAASA